MEKAQLKTFDHFRRMARRAGVAHVVLREIKEVRARPANGFGVVVESVHEATLLAYVSGVLLCCAIPGEEVGLRVSQLEKDGFQIKRVLDNIG